MGFARFNRGLKGSSRVGKRPWGEETVRRAARAAVEPLERRALFTGVIDSPLVITPGQTFPEELVLDHTEIAAFSDTVKDPIGSYSGSIDWGDGSPVEPATNVNYHADTELYWVAGSHVYGKPGSYSVTATIYDGPVGGANTSTKTSVGGPIIIYPVNDAPAGTNDALGTIFEDSGPHTYSFGGLLSNDSAGPKDESDEDAQSLTIISLSDVVGGMAVISGTDVIFTPTADYSGPAGFTYTLRDNGRSGPAGSVADDFKTATATASFTVAEVNDAPTAVADALSSVAEDSGVRTIPFSTLVSNDSKGPGNESGQTLTVTGVSNAVGGTVAINGTNVLFTPDANFNGLASFSYVVRDNGTTNGVSDPKSSTSVAFFNVTPVNDAPTAADDTLPTLDEDPGQRVVPFSVLLGNDSTGPANESDQSLTIVAVGDVVGGTAVIDGTRVLFTPTADFNGAASFSYTVQDNGATGSLADPKTAKATVRVTLREVNDAPIPTDDSIGSFREDSVGIYVTPATLLSNDSPGPANESGQTLSITGVGSAVGGTVAFNGGNIVFTPTPNYFGPASYTYTVQDNGTTAGATDPKTATGTVRFTLTPVNDAPTAGDDALSFVNEDAGARAIPFSSLLGNDSTGPANESGQTLTIIGVSDAVGGTAVIDGTNVVFTPTPNFNGAASFKYTVQDNGVTGTAADPQTAAAEVSFTIREVNDAPVATDDSLAAIAEDSGAYTIAPSALLGNDSSGPANESGQTLTITSVGSAVGGTVSLSGGNVAFTPTANYNGPASFSYVAQDNGTTAGAPDPLSSSAVARFTVTPVNDAPTAGTDTKSTNEDTPLSFPASVLTANDSAGPADEASQTLTATSVSATSAQGGTVTLVNGTIKYTPAANYNGPDSFTYTVTDNGQSDSPAANDFKSATGTVNLTVAAGNDAPTANAASAPVTEDGGTTVTLSGSDVETPAASLVFKITSLPTKGILKAGGVAVTLNQTFAGSPSNLTYESGATNDGPTPDSFTYVVIDSGSPALASAAATVSITQTKAVADGVVTIDSAGVVRVGGTSGNDAINIDVITKNRTPTLRVRRGSQTVTDTIPLFSVTEVRAWGREGNDCVNVEARVRAYLNGGAGADVLVSNGLGDIVVGGTGDDGIYTGGGDDLMVGGAGKDLLGGGGGRDVLVGGQVSPQYTLAALRQVAGSWAASGASFSTSLIGQAFAKSIADTEQDRVTGGSGANWFLVNRDPTDKILGEVKPKKGDVVAYV